MEKKKSGTSLVVQWHLPWNAGDLGLIPGWGTTIPHAKGQLSLGSITEPREIQSEKKNLAIFLALLKTKE